MEGTDAQNEVETGDAGDEKFYAASPEMEVPDQPVEPHAEERAEAAPQPSREERPAPRPHRDFRPAEPASIRKAIDEVMEIVSSLRDSLDKLDELLELLEEAERQKTADEREIESLRQTLRRFQRPPEDIQRQRAQQHPQGGRRDDHRQHRDNRGQHRGHRDQRQRDNRDPRQGAEQQTSEANTPINATGSSDSAEPTTAQSAPPENGPDVGSPS